MSRPGQQVVIVGGGIVGTSIAWWLTQLGGSSLTITVIEQDQSFETASTSHTNSCIRQQFSNALNIELSQFGLEFITNFGRFIGAADAPEISFDEFGYLYLAADSTEADGLRRNHAIQRAAGAATELLGPADLADRWPWLNTDGIVLGSFGPRGEGYFDVGTMFAWLRRMAAANSVVNVTGSVTGIDRRADRVRAVRLADGTTIAADWVVNAAGPRAAQVAAMADIDLPVEARKRYSWVFRCATQLATRVPLTIDPSGVHVRQDGEAFLVGGRDALDVAVPFDDFSIPDDVFEQHVWPRLAHRIPHFDRIKIVNAWAGHYAYNTWDQNALVGAHRDVVNMVFANGFSGHGVQHAVGVGRGIAEWIVFGEYRTIDLSPLSVGRVSANLRFGERNVI